MLSIFIDNKSFGGLMFTGKVPLRKSDILNREKAGKITVSEIKNALKGLRYFHIKREVSDRMNNVVFWMGDFDTQDEFKNYERELKKKLKNYDYVIDDEDVIIWGRK